MAPIMMRKMTKEEATMPPSQNQLLGPNVADRGASVGRGLSHMARRGLEFAGEGSFSLVT